MAAHSSATHLSAREVCANKPCLECRSIGVLDKKGTDDVSKQEREEEEHKQGIAKHDVFGMNIKAKDVGDDGDVRAMDTSMQVPHMVKDIQYTIALQYHLFKHCIPAAFGFIMYALYQLQGTVNQRMV